MTTRLIHADARVGLRMLAAQSVNCVVTSIPYFSLRAYNTAPQVWEAADGTTLCPDGEHEWGDPITDKKRGQAAGETATVSNTVKRVCPPETQQGRVCRRCGCWFGEWGSEPTPDLYCWHVVLVFREVRRVLHDTGTIWLNLGDSMAGSWGNQGRKEERGGQRPVNGGMLTPVGDGRYPAKGSNTGTPPPGFREKNLLQMPARVTMALQADGWTLRSMICCLKSSPMPESLRGPFWERCRVKVRSGALSSSPAHGADYRHHFTSLEAAAGHVGAASREAALEAGTQYESCPGCSKCEKTDGLVYRRASWRPTSAYEYIALLVKDASQDYTDPEAVRVTALQPLGEAMRTGEGKLEALAMQPAPTRNRNGLSTSTLGTNQGSAGRNMWNYMVDAISWNPEPQSFSFCAACDTLYQTAGEKKRIGRTRVDGKTVQTCPRCGATDRWVNHYAAFPSSVPERCIKAGTSERGVCGSCGRPWARILERGYVKAGGGSYGGNRMDADPRNPRSGHIGQQALSRSDTTLGWRPTCPPACPGHGRPAVPATVLDFCLGSGTTALVAQELGRDFCGIDLNRDYLALTRARLERRPVPLAPVAVVPAVERGDAVQLGMFEEVASG